MKVFISGSGSIKKLPDSAIKKINSIIEKEFAIATGDPAMAYDADCALMIWDGLSIEALNIIKAMKDRNKGVCVIVDGVFYDEENSDIIINKLTNR
jgi:hypothetical protein